MAAETPLNRPFACIADVHGNLPALEAVLKELAARGIVDLFVAGDLLLGGKQPLEVWRKLRAINARLVSGPSDEALCRISDPGPGDGSDDARKAREGFIETKKAVGELVLSRLAKLPKRLRVPLVNGEELLLVHGCPKEPYLPITHDMTDTEITTLIDDDPAQFIVCGASHTPFHRDLSEHHLIAVGSVGQAPEGNHAHLSILNPQMTGMQVEQLWLKYA